jgi:effector-binding domain-containing protein
MVHAEVIELEPQSVAVVEGEVAIPELPAFFEDAFTTVMAALQRHGIEPTGPPIGLYPSAPTDRVEVAAGFPTAEPIEADGRVVPVELPGGRAVEAVHVGPYDTMETTYAELQEWMAAEHLEPVGPMWECYLSDPSAEPDPSTWRTRIVWPIR